MPDLRPESTIRSPMAKSERSDGNGKGEGAVLAASVRSLLARAAAESAKQAVSSPIMRASIVRQWFSKQSLSLDSIWLSNPANPSRTSCCYCYVVVTPMVVVLLVLLCCCHTYNNMSLPCQCHVIAISLCAFMRQYSMGHSAPLSYVPSSHGQC